MGRVRACGVAARTDVAAPQQVACPQTAFGGVNFEEICWLRALAGIVGGDALSRGGRRRERERRVTVDVPVGARGRAARAPGVSPRAIVAADVHLSLGAEKCRLAGLEGAAVDGHSPRNRRADRAGLCDGCGRGGRRGRSGHEGAGCAVGLGPTGSPSNGTERDGVAQGDGLRGDGRSRVSGTAQRKRLRDGGRRAGLRAEIAQTRVVFHIGVPEPGRKLELQRSGAAVPAHQAWIRAGAGIPRGVGIVEDAQDVAAAVPGRGIADHAHVWEGWEAEEGLAGRGQRGRRHVDRSGPIIDAQRAAECGGGEKPIIREGTAGGNFLASRFAEPTGRVVGITQLGPDAGQAFQVKGEIVQNGGDGAIQQGAVRRLIPKRHSPHAARPTARRGWLVAARRLPIPGLEMRRVGVRIGRAPRNGRGANIDVPMLRVALRRAGAEVRDRPNGRKMPQH